MKENKQNKPFYHLYLYQLVEWIEMEEDGCQKESTFKTSIFLRLQKDTLP